MIHRDEQLCDIKCCLGTEYDGDGRVILNDGSIRQVDWVVHIWMLVPAGTP